MDKICSFFGHRKIINAENLQKTVSTLVEKLILEKGYNVFLFGGFGEFDELSYQVVSTYQKQYSAIKRVFCLSEEKHLLLRKRPAYLRGKDYEEFIYLPPSFDYWYTRIYYRNCQMIEKSDCIVFYAEERKDSGAYKALEYAQKRKKEYVNIATLLKGNTRACRVYL